jgi:hypothetical protein
MTADTYPDATDWPSALKAVCQPGGKATIVLVQAQPHWLTAASAELRHEVERALGRLLFCPRELCVGRVLVYDPPSTYVTKFVPCAPDAECAMHESMTESLRDWLKVIDRWGTLFTTRRYMKRDRPESERYQVKSWVIAELASARVADNEAALIPPDMLVIGDSGQTLGELYPDAQSPGVGWHNDRLLWMNASASGLDPSVGRRAGEIVASGGAKFFSVDPTTERWWSGKQAKRSSEKE